MSTRSARDQLPALLVLFLVWGCAGPPEIQIVRYPGVAVPAPRGSDCEDIEIVDDPDGVEGCVQFADIFLGDSGSTHPCDPETLRGHLREQACLAGADSAVVLRLTPPRGGSSCHQMRAGLLTCGSGD
jgi:hypothetical protein